MKIWYSPYKLTPIAALNRFKKNTRAGFLIKIQTRSIEAGYADCHPLLEFGDPNINTLLRQYSQSPLLERSIQLARIDGRAREDKKSLFSRQKIKSHYTCADIHSLNAKTIDQIRRRGFTTIKIKVGAAPEREALYLNTTVRNPSLRWRFDANGAGGDRFLSHLDDVHLANTEFIEDPLPFREEQWTALENKYNVQCAFDRPLSAGGNRNYKGIRVIKPAREKTRFRRRDIITNSMDHPVGQSFAFWAAQVAVARWGEQPVDFGLMTSHLFRSNEFFNQIASPDCYFRPSEGYGVGFDHLLKRQKWIAL